ncbi:MAG: dTDP-4-dehydrorhamnose 3,5-epimerase [Candidatus Aquilonibacter sp.]
MEVVQLPIDGALIIVPRVFSDERGYFKEIYAASRYRAQGIDATFVQDNLSFSQRFVLRGLHTDPRMAKIVQVLTGAAYDVIVDVRRESPSFMRWHAVTLRAYEHTQIYIPAGCLHGFLALEDETSLLYKQSSEYDPAAEFGIAWNDPDLAIAWPLEGATPILSAKDASNPTLRERGLL